MKVNVVNSSGYFEQIKRNKKKDSDSGFENNFAENLGRSPSKEPEESSPRIVDAKKECGIDYSAITSGINRCAVSGIEKTSIAPCSIKNISYEEYDNVKVCIEDGCTYKAKVFSDREIVYVERKNEDGSVEAFEVNINNLDLNNSIEKMAADTIEKYSAVEDTSEEVDFQAAFLKFYKYVQERIENGPPKFMIGSTEMSIEEWDKMIKEIDELLDEIKEELREQVENQEKSEENAERNKGLVKEVLQEGRF